MAIRRARTCGLSGPAKAVAICRRVSLHLIGFHLSFCMTVTSVNEKGLKPRPPNLPKPALNTPRRRLCGARGLFDGFAGQNLAYGHQTPANPRATLAGERGLNLVLADP